MAVKVTLVPVVAVVADAASAVVVGVRLVDASTESVKGVEVLGASVVEPP